MPKYPKLITGNLILFILLIFSSFSLLNAGIYEDEKFSLMDTKIDSNTTLLGRWVESPVSPTYAIDVKNDTAFFGYGSKMIIVDYTNAGNPVKLGEYSLNANLKDIKIEGNYAYVVDPDDGLSIIDISNPANPQLVSVKGGDSFAEALTIYNDYAYVVGGYNGLCIVDITDKSAPAKIDSFDINGYGFAWDVELHGIYAFVAFGDSGVSIIDVSIPQLLDEVGRIETESQVQGIAIQGTTLYLAEFDNGVRTFDISTATNPQFLGHFDTEGDAWDIAVSGDFAYVADNMEGLKILDISNPENLFLAGFYNTFDVAYKLALNDSIVYLADSEDGLYVILNDKLMHREDSIFVSVPDMDVLVFDTLNLPILVEFPQDSGISAFEMHLIGFENDLNVLSIDIAGSLLDGKDWLIDFNDSDSGLFIAAAGDTDIFSSGTLLTLVMTVKDGSQDSVPILFNNVKFNSGNMTTDTENGVVTVFSFDSGDADLNGVVEALDASEILQYLNGTIDFDIHQLEFANVSSDTTISALDASLILQYLVHKIPQLPFDSTMGNLAAKGNLAMFDKEFIPGESIGIPLYISNGDNILSFEGKLAFDSDALEFVEFIPSDSLNNFTIFTGESENEVAFSGAGEIPDGKTGIFSTLIFMVRSDYEGNEIPLRLEKLRWNEEAVQFNVAEMKLLKITGVDDISAFPDKLTLYDNYPNPFNARTTFSYYLPESADIGISIFDVSGRIMEEIYYGSKESGKHTFSWNADTYSSGVYFYQIKSKNQSVIKKCILLK